jgi:hypothetical protein
MTRKRTIIIVILAILIFAGVIWGLVFLQKRFSPASGEEIFSLAAVVSEVRPDKNFLTVIPQGKDNEIKVVVSNKTKLLKLEAPFSEDNPPPAGTQFTPEQTEITLSDFHAGDEVFIKTLKNIAGKKEFGDVELIQILP